MILSDKELNFEKALKRLKQISEEIVKDETTLEKSQELLEESEALIEFCREKISELHLMEENENEPLDNSGD
jgi:exodeoxyribonuclease VII small subunit